MIFYLSTVINEKSLNKIKEDIIRIYNKSGICESVYAEYMDEILHTSTNSEWKTDAPHNSSTHSVLNLKKTIVSRNTLYLAITQHNIKH